MKEPMSQPSFRPAAKQPPAHAPNAAMLIDFDNVTMGIRSDLQQELRRLMNSDIIRGKVAVQRAYADWRRYPQYIVPLSEASIDLIFAPAFGSNKKNATDIRLAIDALELIFTRPEIGTFILLSGDSDFSSLVIKLKEYGKYVIGVGIRESSSDLLIQNCDEYFSYNELAGLTRVADEQIASRDPWELVVDSLLEMRKRGDVMRSDRLKQVMQEMDPSFDEKNVGMSRFSKFVEEARKRGLLIATKLANGQYEIDLGPSAPGGEKALPPIPGEPDERRQRERAEGDRDRPTRGRRGGRGAKVAEAAGLPPAPAPAGGVGPLSLAEAYEFLKRTLREMHAVAPTIVSEDPVRERMAALTGRPDDPIFHRPRFGRLLRQAHDASIVDVSKTKEGFLVTLRPEAAAAVPETAPAETAPAESGAKGRGRRGGRGRGREGKSSAGAQLEFAPSTAPAPEVRAETPPPAAPPAQGLVRSPILRWRRGSKGRPEMKAGVPLVGVVEVPDVPSKTAKPAARKPRGPRGPAAAGGARRGGRPKKGKGPASEA
jgi:uncharacterized protein (TIGR00288 family)